MRRCDLQRCSIDIGLALSLGALALTLLAGCWEEVHYVGTVEPPEGGLAPHATENDTPGDNARGRFGEGLAAKLDDRPKSAPSASQHRLQVSVDPPAEKQAATSPAAPAQPSAAITVSTGGRYQSLPPKVEMGAEPNEPAQPGERPTTDWAVDAADWRGSSQSADKQLATEPTNQPAAPVNEKGAELVRKPAAPPESPPVPTTHSLPKTRRAAWLLGSKWSLAYLARERGAASDDVDAWLAQSRDLAATLGVTLNDLPPRGAAKEGASVSRTITDELLEHGQRLSGALATTHGPDHAGLFDVALKSNLLIMGYEPGSRATAELASAISQASRKTVLSSDLWQPLLKAIADRAPAAEVRQAVFRLHDDVDKILARMAER
jgi:hypothetical protein